MIEKIVTAVTDWPVIVQALFGSALFAGISWAGQRLVAFAAKEYASRSKKRRLEYLLDLRIKYVAASSADSAQQTTIMVGLVYKCSRACVKALIWLVLGFAGSVFLSSLGAIGCIGALFYLFSALNLVKPIDRTVDAQATIKELSQEIDVLRAA